MIMEKETLPKKTVKAKYHVIDPEATLQESETPRIGKKVFCAYHGYTHDLFPFDENCLR